MNTYDDAEEVEELEEEDNRDSIRIFAEYRHEENSKSFFKIL